MTREQNDLGLAVIAACVSHFEADIREFNAGTRTRREVNARHAAWNILRKVYGMSLNEVSAITGYDHTSVMNGTRPARYSELQEDIEEIRQMVTVAVDVRAHQLLRRIKRELLKRPELYEALEAVISEKSDSVLSDNKVK